MTDAEHHVKSLLETDGIHVIHFWAPWCDNSTSELADGWYEVAESEANADVSFTFVTIWNDGESGRELMTKYALPGRVQELIQPDPGPSEILENRRHTFLGLPVTWIPTTWIFHNNGQLAYAFNYGELQMETLQHAIDNTRNPWTQE